MRARHQVTLFPFLSVLVSTMGVLSFLAVTFLLLVRHEQSPEKQPPPVEVQWVGAPEHVRPLLVACREDGIAYGVGKGEPPRFFSLAELRREVRIVKDIVAESRARIGAAPNSYRLWVYLKNAIQREERLFGTFTAAVHQVELSNLSGEGRKRFIQHYPILLVYPDGLDSYDLVSYLVETTTRLSVGLEPMLDGWAVPYQGTAAAPSPAKRGRNRPEQG